MRTLFSAAGLAAVFSMALSAVAAPALAVGPSCISTRDITGQTVEGNGKAIVFHMRDGTYIRNTLQGACPDLKFEGYVWTIRNPDQTVCERMQSLKVLHSGEVCMLGKFDQVPKPAPHS